MGATHPVHRSPVSVPAPGKPPLPHASHCAHRDNIDKAPPDLGFVIPHIADSSVEGMSCTETQRVVIWTNAMGRSIISSKSWIPIRILLLTCWWFGQAVSLVWASFSSSLK